MRLAVALSVGVLSVIAFALTAASASGSTIRSNITSYTATSAGSLTLDPGGLNVSCNLTMAFGMRSATAAAASLPATLSNFGTVTTSVGFCSGGVTLTLLSQPWSYDLIVDGGAGVVTGSTRLRLSTQFAITIGAFRCLFAGPLVASVNAAGTQATVNGSVPFSGGSILCPAQGDIAGTLAGSPAIAITLS